MEKPLPDFPQSCLLKYWFPTPSRRQPTSQTPVIIIQEVASIITSQKWEVI